MLTTFPGTLGDQLRQVLLYYYYYYYYREDQGNVLLTITIKRAFNITKANYM
jgi:hypothetical protein